MMMLVAAVAVIEDRLNDKSPDNNLPDDHTPPPLPPVDHTLDDDNIDTLHWYYYCYSIILLLL